MNCEAKYVESFGTTVGTNEDGEVLVGIIVPAEGVDEDEDVYTSLHSAKVLLCDLKDAIEEAEQLQKRLEAARDY